MEEVTIRDNSARLPGLLTHVEGSKGLVVFAHGSGSGRLSPRNQFAAQKINQAGISTLLFDLLTEEESTDRTNVFSIPLLASRLESAIAWAGERDDLEELPLGLFGASTGAAAALVAAADLGNRIKAVVSRGGRPDMAIPRLPEVVAPTLLLVGGKDYGIIELNEKAAGHLRTRQTIIVPGATHLFEEPGALEQVCEHAAQWFLKKLPNPNK